MDAFHEANRSESLAGRIVLSVEIVTYGGATDPERADTEQKRMLDELHCHKVRMADEVLILNVGGYIGESTRRELELAKSLRKRVRFLEAPDSAADYAYLMEQERFFSHPEIVLRGLGTKAQPDDVVEVTDPCN